MEKEKDRTGQPAQASGWKQIQNIGILFDAQNLLSRILLKSLLRALKPYNIPLAVVGFDKAKSKLPPFDIPFFAYTSKDFSIFGGIKDGQLKNFIAKPFDLLIDVSLSETARTGKIIVRSAARFKIAVNKESDSFDFIFSMPVTEKENPSALTEMLDYIAKITLNPEI